MALGPQLRQKPRPSASVFVYWVPWAIFFTRHGRPWSNPTILHSKDTESCSTYLWSVFMFNKRWYNTEVKTSIGSVVAAFEQWLIQHSWYSIWIYETRCSATFSKLLHAVLFLIPRPYNVPLCELCEFNPHFEHDRFSASLLVVYVSCAKASKLNTKCVFYFTTSLP